MTLLSRSKAPRLSKISLSLALLCLTAGGSLIAQRPAASPLPSGDQVNKKKLNGLVKPVAQAPAPPAAAPATTADVDHASAYYHFGLAHLYEDMATNAGRADYAAQAIEQYKLAMDADPTSPALQTGLADLYFKLGRIRDAVVAAQEQVKNHPDDLEAHQLLGRIYLRSLGDTQTSQSGDMVKLAIGEYEKITQLKPDDLEAHLLLGQLYGFNHDSVKAEEQFKLAQKLDGSSEEVVLNMARLYSEQGDNKRALEVLQSVPADDRSERVNFALAVSYDQMRQPHEAVAAYQAVIDGDPTNLDAIHGLTSALVADEQFDKALPLLTRMAAADPTDAQIQVRLAEVQRRTGNYEAALATLRKAKATVTDPTELEYNEALTLDALGRYDEAVAVLNTLLAASNHPDGVYSEPEKQNRTLFLERLGTVYRYENKIPDAVAAYKQIIPFGGDYIARGYGGVIDAYNEGHDSKDATAAAAEAAKALPNDRGVQRTYAQQLADNGKPDEGIAMIRAQLKHNAEDKDVYVALAQVESRLHRVDPALADLTEAEKLAATPSDHVYIEFLRGTVYDREKNLPMAEAAFRRALAIEPDNPMVLNYIGYMLADHNTKLDEALVFLKHAVDLDPQNGAYLDSLGWVYFRMGNYKLAEENLTKATSRIATDPTVHDHLGQVYEKTGRLQLAIAQWERSMTEYTHSLSADTDPADVQKVKVNLENARTKLAKAQSR